MQNNRSVTTIVAWNRSGIPSYLETAKYVLQLKITGNMLKYFPERMFDTEKVKCICVKVSNTKFIHAKMLNICKRRFVAFQDVLPVE